jgi:hypothetical protein
VSVRIVVVITYLAVMAAWIYGVFATSIYHDAWWIFPLAAIQIGIGYLIGRWWALLLPLSVPLLGIPAGTAEQRETPAPFILLFFVPLLQLLVAVGTLFRKARERRAEAR